MCTTSHTPHRLHHVPPLPIVSDDSFSYGCSRDLCVYFGGDIVPNPAFVSVAGVSGDVAGRASAGVRQPQPAAAVPPRLRRLTAKREPDRRLPSRSRPDGVPGQYLPSRSRPGGVSGQYVCPS